MPDVQRVHYEALDDYHSYDLQWLGPIVYPLSFALIIQGLVYADMLHSRSQTLQRCCRSPLARLLRPCTSQRPKDQPACNACVDVVVLWIMISETIFALLCIVQCSINFGSRSFVGGSGACDFQAFYATYYTFSSMGLAAYGFTSTSYILNVEKPKCAVLGTRGFLVHCVALAVASLPLVGFGGYLFPKDYCMHNVESGFFAVIFLICYTACMGAMIESALKLRSWNKGQDAKAKIRIMRLLAFMAVYFFTFAWSTSMVIVIVWLINGNVYSSTAWRLYGAQAIILHSNQLFLPLLFGGLWRYRMLDIVSPSSLEVVDVSVKAATKEVTDGIKDHCSDQYAGA
mmetsp:Transcript_1503/g.2689  ORF Transcript_1503/g.2689 Transcript_1503/m.2689 type:complete len:343 (-) Transcript_1503:226-1254(-)